MVGAVPLSNTTVPTMAAPGFPFPAGNPNYQSQDRMFYGMSAFRLSRAIQRLFNLQTISYGNLATGYLSNYGTYGVTIDYFW